MIELEVLKKVRNIKKSNLYSIVISFTCSDDFEQVKFEFSKDQLKDQSFNEELEEFVKCIYDCIKLDSKGRRGYDEFEKVIKHYGFIKQWSKFCQNIGDDYYQEDFEELNDELELCMDPFKESFFNYFLPISDYGFIFSYKELNVFYYDSEGDMHDVKINLS